MSVRLRRVAARGAKRLLAILLILACLFGATGVPVVVRVSKDHSQPFPCQDNPCGCSSADECWHHCCCHTNRQKVAWAHEHGVTPPDFVVAAAEKEDEPASPVCCHQHRCEKCAAKIAAHHDTSNATDTKATDTKATHTNATDTKHALGARLVLVDLARHCRSLPQVWSLLVIGLPVRLETAWSFDQQVVGRVTDAPVLAWRVELSPPVPPPKLGLLSG